jgi:hypothetical protein
VVEEFDAAGVDADVVRGPAAAELLAPRGELPAQVREVPVVGVAAGFGAQQGDGVVGGLVVVAEERLRAGPRGPPVRFAAGADAVATFEQKAHELLAQAEAHRELSSSLAHAEA